MRRPAVRDKSLILLLAILLLFAIAIGLIWWHYDTELQRIEKQSNELKQYSN